MFPSGSMNVLSRLCLCALVFFALLVLLCLLNIQWTEPPVFQCFEMLCIQIYSLSLSLYILVTRTLNIFPSLGWFYSQPSPDNTFKSRCTDWCCLNCKFCKCKNCSPYHILENISAVSHSGHMVSVKELSEKHTPSFCMSFLRIF